MQPYRIKGVSKHLPYNEGGRADVFRMKAVVAKRKKKNSEHGKHNIILDVINENLGLYFSDTRYNVSSEVFYSGRKTLKNL